MATLIAEIPDHSLKGALEALSPYVKPENLKLFSPIAVPKDQGDDELAKLAQKVVDAVRPKPSQPLRREALQKLLSGHDTFSNQTGQADPALRNAMGAISKALKTVLPTTKQSAASQSPRRHTSPMALIAEISKFL